MRNILTFMILLATAFFVSGCAGDLSLLESLGERVGVDPIEAAEKAQEIEDKTLGKAAEALPIYCKAPLRAREVIRDRINSRPEAEGASLYIYCPGDPYFKVPATDSGETAMSDAAEVGIGDIVRFRLGQDDADEINRLRDKHGVSHVNPASSGGTLPLIITAVWSETCVNGRLVIDGCGSVGDLWLTSVELGHGPGQWWPRD